MKKKNYLKYISLLLSFVCLFSGCGKTNEEKKSAEAKPTAEVDGGAYIIEPSEPMKNGSSVIEANGSSDRYSLIKFIDNKTLKKVVLCNKPDCLHRDASCNAYLPSPFTVKQENGEVRFPLMHTDGCVFLYNEKLYSLDPFGDIVVMNRDGANHRKILTVDSKYTIKKSLLYKNNLYLQVTYIPSYDPNTEREFSDSDYSLALLKIDLEKGACKEVVTFKNELETELLGISNDKAYYFCKSPNTLPSASTQDAVDNEENGHSVKLFSCDLNDGSREVIYENLKSLEFDAPILFENSICFQSRRTGEFKKLNLDNMQSETIVSDFSYYIEYFYPEAFIDSKLFFIKNNSLTDAFADPPNENETYYLDLETKEIKKILPLRGFYAETEDYYIFNYEGKTVALKKENFYANSHNFTEV